MRFDRRFFFVLGISLGWGLLVAAAFYRESAVPAGSFARVEDVLDRPVINPIQPDEPVIEARIAAKGSGMGLAPLIPSGMRAISVRVNDVVGVSGFVLPGMRVDVLVTGRPPNQQDTVVRTVLQNIAVLSAGQTIQTDGKSQSMVVPVVTLLVEPQEAEALTLANNEGHIQLVLRNSMDDKRAATQGRQLRDLYGVAKKEEAPGPALPNPNPTPTRHPVAPAATRRAPPPPIVAQARTPTVPPPQVDQVIVMNGAKKTIEVFPR
jgi:pilus assembly protein CpaB